MVEEFIVTLWKLTMIIWREVIKSLIEPEFLIGQVIAATAGEAVEDPR